MAIDVSYEGIVLATGAAARASEASGEGLFVPLESPPPVGTRLTLRGDETAGAEASAVVSRVREGEGAGVFLRLARAGAADAPAAPVISITAEPEPDEAEVDLAAAGGDPER